jgi:hypothetical protein
VWPAMTSLISCLCQEVTASGLPELCFCGLLPGENVPGDYVTEDGGMGWVRLVSAYPSVVFPGQDSTATCVSPLAFELEIGLLYCAPVIDQFGEPPSVVSQFEATRVQTAAMAAMRRALVCCLRPGVDAVLGAYTPMGPEGQVVGGTWQVFVSEGVV